MPVFTDFGDIPTEIHQSNLNSNLSNFKVEKLPNCMGCVTVRCADLLIQLTIKAYEITLLEFCIRLQV